MAEDIRSATGLSRLTARERASLDLVARGLTVTEGAERLGIGASTFSKFLAGARAKLGVSRTTEAVAICVAEGVIGRKTREHSAAAQRPGTIRAVEDLLTDLEHCNGFPDAWSVFCRHASRIGTSSVQFALVAEPRGRLTSGARLIATSYPAELAALYDRAGGISRDPVTRWMAGGGGWLSLRTDRVPARIMRQFSPQMAEFAAAVPDHGCRCILGSVLRDGPTGASFALPFSLGQGEARDAARRPEHYRDLQSVLSAAFWRSVQDRALLRQLVPLTARMREALQDAAHGLGAAESAERMGISRRAVEKLLSEARSVFRAPTTAAAIYRAGVYRALA